MISLAEDTAVARYYSPEQKLRNRIRMKSYYDNPEKREIRDNYVKSRKNRRKFWFKKYKEARGCDKCGLKDDAVVYDWHHLKDKEFDINTSMLKSLKRLFKEIRKCVLVCANCHRKIHYQEGFDL